MLKKTIDNLSLLICFLCLQTIVRAQDSNIVKKPAYIHASIYYDFPESFGASAGVDWVFSSKQKIKTGKDGKQYERNRDWIINTDLGFYRYRFNNTGIFLMPSVGKRYSDEQSYYFEWLAGLGLVRTFYDGIVYSVDDAGKVKEESYFGRWYAAVNAAATFGWDLSKAKNQKPFALQVKPVLWFQFPYNSFLLPHLSIEAGIKYHFNNFNTKVRRQIIH